MAARLQHHLQMHVSVHINLGLAGLVYVSISLLSRDLTAACVPFRHKLDFSFSSPASYFLDALSTLIKQLQWLYCI
jgi:hypothetical protein